MSNANIHPIPPFLYGTAWKEEATKNLTLLAMQSGFRGIDTANQRKHYYEEAVGQGIAEFLQEGVVSREELFLQTKFTFQAGQDDRLPYDPHATYAKQVEQSFESSLQHLQTDYIDSYVLHGPMLRHGLHDADLEAWQAMETVHQQGYTKLLGVSNVSIKQLEALYKHAKSKPAFVQNRCYAELGWDQEVRSFCQKNNIIYQGFSLLTANRHVLAHVKVQNMAKGLKITPAQVIFCFSSQIGMLPLTGTTNTMRMLQDLEALNLSLESHEIDFLTKIG